MTLAAIINWGSNTKEILKISQMMDTNFLKKYQPNQKFALFEYWSKKFLGIHSLNEEFQSPMIEKHGVLYLSIVPIESETLSKPVFLTSTFHIKQGLAEIKSFVMEKNKIKIQMEMKGTRSGSVFFLIPPRMELKSEKFPVKNYDVLNGRIAEISFTLKDEATLSLQF
jgi:hypothetical protein